MKCVLCNKELTTGDNRGSMYCNTCYDLVHNSPVLTTIMPLKKLLLIEDGSVDLDELADLEEKLGIRVIVYRKGSTKPEIIDLEKK